MGEEKETIIFLARALFWRKRSLFYFCWNDLLITLLSRSNENGRAVGLPWRYCVVYQYYEEACWYTVCVVGKKENLQIENHQQWCVPSEFVTFASCVPDA